MDSFVSQLPVFLDKGIIAGLFVFCFVLFIWKGIPFFVTFLKEIQSEHTKQIILLTETFRNTMEQITTKFIAQVEHQHKESTSYHQKHFEMLTDVKEGLKKVEERISVKQ